MQAGAPAWQVSLLSDLMALSAGAGAWLPRHRKVRDCSAGWCASSPGQ